MKIVSLSAIVLLFTLSCKKNKEVLSSDKRIIAFVLRASSNSGLTEDIRAEIVADTIKLAIPSVLSLTNLIPDINYIGKSLSPVNNTPENFSNPVTYTVTAADGSTKKYIVVARYLNATKDILSFMFKASYNTGVTQDVNGSIDKDTIRITVDAINVTNLLPTIVHNGNKILPDEWQGRSFVNPVDYTVVAEDGTTKKYTVLVSSSASLFIGGHDGNLYSFDAGTGKIKWKYSFGISVLASPTYADSTVFVGNGSYFYAIDAFTGKLKWKTYLLGGTAVNSSQVENDVVYTTVGGYGIIALNKQTGSIIWKQQMSPLNGPTVNNGLVVVPDYDFRGQLRCFNALTGSPLWNHRTGFIKTNVAMIDGKVFAGAEYYGIVCIDAATGIKKWHTPIYPGNQNLSLTASGASITPTIHKGVLYTDNTRLRAYDTATGLLKWEYVNATISRPVGENGVIYAISPSGDFVFAINSNGSLKWQSGNVGGTSPGPEPHLYASPTISHGIVYTGFAINKKIIAVSASTGQLIWSHEGIAPFTTGPCIVDGQGKTFHSSVSGAQQ
jgi:outer membrane protein assembly factor BamB